MKYLFIIFFIAFTLCQTSLFGQKQSNEQVRQLVSKYKADLRGLYKDIQWFCKDGSFVAPKEKCPEPGGVQRARYKKEVIDLAESNHLFFGQILSTTPTTDFWDRDHRHSRIKQYQLEKYLRSIDDGWILKKAQYYREAFQVEDEEAWGQDFFKWLLNDKTALAKNYFLIRQAAKDIPHRGDDNSAQKIRSLSKVISDDFSAFTDLRVKIHGQPEVGDIQKVKAFKTKYQAKLSTSLQKQLNQ